MKKLTNLLQWRQFGAVFFPNLHSEINEVWLEIHVSKVPDNVAE